MGNFRSLDDASTLKDAKILSSYKVLLLLSSYGADNNIYGREPDKKLKKGVFRSKIDNFIKLGKFSQVDDMFLKLVGEPTYDPRVSIVEDIEQLKFYVSCNNKPMPLSMLPDGDLALLKKLQFITGSPNDDFFKAVDRFFRNNSYLKATKNNLIESINLEVERREKASARRGVSANASLDDNALDELKEKVSRCTTLNDLNDLLMVYKGEVGCDLMNGFLKGNLSGIRSKKLKVKIPTDSIKRQKKGAYGTDFSEVPLNLILDTIVKTLKLKKEVLKGKVEGIETLYKGVTIDRLLSDMGVSKSDFFRQVFKNRDMKRITKDGQVEEHANFEKMAITEKHILKYVNEGNPKPIYTSKGFISTSSNEGVAWGYAKLSYRSVPVVLNINVNKNTIVGIDFSKRNFGIEDGDSEILLQPNQKIRLNKAEIVGKVVKITCETI